MPSTSTLMLFCPAALVLLIIPGPSVLYIVTRSIDQGRRAGFISILGTHVGSLVHVFGAAFGLSALIVSSALAFSAVKYLGAAYLVWLAVRRWRAGDRIRLPAADGANLSTGRLFRQGLGVARKGQTVIAESGAASPHIGPCLSGRLAYRLGSLIVQVLNPKTAIFFLAFLPQFVDAHRGSVSVQVLILGVVFIALGLMSDGTYALAASTVGTVLRRSTRARRAERYISTGVYVGLGVSTAAVGGHSTASS